MGIQMIRVPLNTSVFGLTYLVKQVPALAEMSPFISTHPYEAIHMVALIMESQKILLDLRRN